MEQKKKESINRINEKKNENFQDLDKKEDEHSEEGFNDSNRADIKEKLSSIYQDTQEDLDPETGSPALESGEVDSSPQITPVQDDFPPPPLLNVTEAQGSDDKEVLSEAKGVFLNSLEESHESSQIAGKDDAADNSQSLQNIYDKILRIFYYYRNEWLAVIQDGIFYGIVDKKTVLARLSEISGPMKRRLSEGDIRLPLIKETLMELGDQTEVLPVDFTGQLDDPLSRPVFLALIEKVSQVGEPISVLEVEYAHQARSRPDRDLPQKNEKKNEEKNEQGLDWLLSLMLDTFPQIVVAVDAKGRILYFNAHFRGFIKDLITADNKKHKKNTLSVVEDFETFLQGKLSQWQKQSSSGSSKDKKDKKDKTVDIILLGKKSRWQMTPLLLQKHNIGYMFYRAK